MKIYLIEEDRLRPVGQPYFLAGVQDAARAKAMIATTGTMRRSDENICIKTVI